MKTSTKKGFAIAWLVIAALFGGTAALQLYSMLLGFYNPVTADGVPPERLPYFYAYLISVIVVSATSGIFVLRYVRKQSHDA